jgi:hypothetical protein
MGDTGSSAPRLSADLRAQLALIVPSRDRDIEYYPCDVRLRDGRIVERVYLVSEGPYIQHWGIYPSADPWKPGIQLTEIASLTESRWRLPPRFANELYIAGESGMGYTVFTVVFSRRFGLFLRKRRSYLTGNAVDFIDYPRCLSGKDVLGVLPHVGRKSQPRQCPGYSWCLYSE